MESMIRRVGQLYWREFVTRAHVTVVIVSILTIGVLRTMNVLLFGTEPDIAPYMYDFNNAYAAKTEFLVAQVGTIPC